jgi:hypothetical protein
VGEGLGGLFVLSLGGPGSSVPAVSRVCLVVLSSRSASSEGGRGLGGVYGLSTPERGGSVLSLGGEGQILGIGHL